MKPWNLAFALAATLACATPAQAQVPPAAAETAAYQGLHAAAARGDVPAISKLIAARADVNARDQFGDTPLIVACAKGNGATAALLLERGADPTLKDQEGRTAAERAAPGTGPCRRPR